MATNKKPSTTRQRQESDFENSIHDLAIIMSEDQNAIKYTDIIYMKLGLSAAELFTMKKHLNLEGDGSYGYNFFRNTLSKWHGGLGSNATVKDLIVKLKEISNLEACIEKIEDEFSPLR